MGLEIIIAEFTIEVLLCVCGFGVSLGDEYLLVVVFQIVFVEHKHGEGFDSNQVKLLHACLYEH